MWYEDPAWYALAVSALSMMVSIIAFRNARRGARSTIQQRLTQHAMEINEAILRHGVRGPYSHRLHIPDERLREFAAKSVVLLHQTNLLHDVFENRDILGERIVSAYRNWASVILRPWIEADEDLRASWRIIRDSKDLYSEDFIQWLQKLFPILNAS